MVALTGALWLAGCAPAGQSSLSTAAPAITNIEYYPYLVKGYQNSYPKRRILILMPVDAHQATAISGAAATSYQGNTAIGMTEDATGRAVEELYAPPLAPVVQNAIQQSATEAGLIATLAPDAVYVPAKNLNEDYVLESRIVRCWVTKRPGPGGDAGPAWFSAAEFAVEVTIYKPPFTVPFWQGKSGSNYDDPPVDSNAISPEDETAIYDQPGQVLSVAMTRAVAGIFDRTELYALVNDDRMSARR